MGHYKMFWGQITNMKSFRNSSKEGEHKLRFYKVFRSSFQGAYLEVCALKKTHLLHNRDCKGTLLGICAIVADRHESIQFLTTPPPAVRVRDIFAFLSARCFLGVTMDHWCVAALEKRSILVANNIKRNWLSA